MAESDKKNISSKKQSIEKEPVKKVRLKKAVVKTSVKEPLKTKLPVKKERLKVESDAVYATGRRKESTAKVWIFKGSGVIRINHQDPNDYLSCGRLVKKILAPISILNLMNKYNIRIDVKGGGLTGQAEASTLGISRALLSINEEFRSALRAEGFLTQDMREKERKKYGKRGARKSPQYRKR